MIDPHDALARLTGSIGRLRAGQLDAAELAAVWRAETGLLERLPAAFAAVMEDTLARLESSSLFAEESCSFSQADLIGNLETWVAKAAARLA